MSRGMLINVDLPDETIEFVNWMRENIDEYRQFGDRKLLAFVSRYDLNDFFDELLVRCPSYFEDGVVELAYNGSEYVIDIYYMLSNLDVDPKLVYDNWEEKYD